MNFLILLLNTSLVMSVIMLGFLIFFKIFDNFFTAKTRYIVWIIFLLGLLIPFRPTIGSGLINIKLPLENLSVQSEVLNADYETFSQNSNIKSSEKNSDNIIFDLTLNNEHSTTENTKNINLDFSVVQIALFVWFIGFAVLFSKKILEYKKFHKLIKRWANTVTNSESLNILEDLKSKMGINRQILLMSCSLVSTPMLTGLFKPMIILPEKDISKDELRLILKHELTHYKHNDLFVNLLIMCVISIHWFNPILYFCLPAVQQDGENYCDESVLNKKDIDYRRFYGELILRMISIKPSKQTVLSTCFYNKKLNLKRRLINIMKTNKNIKKFSIASIVAVLGLTVLSGSVIVFASPSSKNTKNLIGIEKAKAIALRDAKLKESSVTFITAKLDKDDGVQIYDIEFYNKNKEYDYEIDAVNGSIREKDTDIENYPKADNNKNQNNKTNNKNNTKNNKTATQNGKNLIGIEKAKSISLNDAGFKAESVTFTKAKLDKDDGVQIYDIEFYSQNKEYDYEIDAINGSIREKDTDIED